MTDKTLTFDEWLKHKEIDSKALTGAEWVDAKKEYNIYKLRSEKLVDKIVKK